MSSKTHATYELITGAGNSVELNKKELKDLDKKGIARIKRAIMRNEDGKYLIDIISWEVKADNMIVDEDLIVERDSK